MATATLPPRVPAALQGGRAPRYAEGGQTSPELAFVKQMYPYARAWSEKTGIPPQVFVAIGASETNWGRAGGFFGIKGASPSGRSQNYATWEMVNGKPVQTNDNFAVYDDPNEAFQHFTGLISSGRYAPAWQQFQQSGDWQTLLRGINDAGYATDPQWWQKIGSLSNTVLKYANDTGAATAPAAKVTPGAPPGTAPTPAAQQGYRANVDPTLLEKYNAAVGQMTTGLARLATLQQKQANGSLTNEEQFELMQLPTQITAAKAVVDVLQPMVKPGATESPLQQATAQAQINNSTATTLGSLQTAAANLVHTGFGDNLAAATYMQGIVKDAFDRAKDTYSLALQKGQLDLNGYAALVTATATAQTAEAAYALQALRNANYISDENWKRAQMLLPAGTHYQPGFAPNSPMNVALKGLGLGQMVMETTPLPADFNDPQKNLTAGSQANERMGYANPAQAFQPFISQLQGQVQRNAAALGFSFTPPEGFAAQPVAAPSYADQAQAYQSIINNFTNGAYVPQIGSAPGTQTGATPPASTPAASGVGMGDLLALEATLATPPNTTTANSFMTIGPNGEIVGNTAPRVAPPAQAIANAGTAIAQTVHSFLPTPTGVVGAVKPAPAGADDNDWFDDPANGNVQFNRRGDRRVKPGT